MRTPFSPSAAMAAAIVSICLAAIVLAGCPREQPIAKPAAPLGAAAPVAQATSASDAADSAAEHAQADRLAKLSANVNAAKSGVEADEKPVALGELTVAQGRLSDVSPDPLEAAAAAERRALVEAGRAEEARTAYAAAAKEGKQAATRIRELEQQATALAAERDAAVAAYAAQAERNMVAQQKAIDAALARAKDGVLKDQVAWLNRIGFTCLAITIGALGLGLAIGGLAALRRVGPLALITGLGALLCFGAAQIVGAWWFIWAVAGAIAIIVAWGAIWFYRHQKKGDLTAELATRSAKVAAVAEKAVPVLDAAYEAAEKPMKDWLDAHVFDRLSSLMDKPEKDTVKQIRATVPEVVTK